MSRTIFLGMILIILLPISLIAQNYNACVKNTPFHIVVLGSSTAAGSGPTSIDSAWVNRYRRHIQSINPLNQVTNLGVGGTTTYHIMPDWFSAPNRPTRTTTKNISEAVRLGADAVIVNMPSNDASNGFGPTEQLFNFRTIKQVADSFNIQLWVCTTQPKNFSSSASKQIQIDVKDSILLQYGNNAIDFWTGIADTNFDIKPIYNSGDGTHLNNLAHRELNQRVINKLIPNYLADTLSYADFTIDLMIEENPCGDSAERVSAIVSNLGIPNLFTRNLKIAVTHNNQTTLNSLSISSGLQGCTSDTVFITVNTSSGGTFQLRAFLDAADSIIANDTSNLVTITRKGHPSISASDGYYCPTDSARLAATSNNTIVWYDSISSAIPFHIGPSYSFLPAANPTNVFVEAVSGPLHYKETFDLTRSTNINFNGQMFDIIPNDTIVLDSLDVPINTLGNQKVVAYYRYGSHIKNESDPSKWTYWGIDSAFITTAGEIASFNYSNIQLLPNNTFAIYLHLLHPNSNLAYQNTPTPAVFTDQLLSVPSGSGISSTFSIAYSPRNFAGRIHYHHGFNPKGDCQSPRIKVSAIQSNPYLDLGNDTTLSSLDSIYLSPFGFTNYHWSNGDTTNQLLVSTTTFGIGSHTIILTAEDSLGCVNSDTIVVTISPSTQLRTNTFNTLSIAPNPTNGMVNLTGVLDPKSAITLYNTLGELVLKAKTPSSTIDLSHLPKGIYFLTITNGQAHFSEKIVLY